MVKHTYVLSVSKHAENCNNAKLTFTVKAGERKQALWRATSGGVFNF